MTRVLPNWIFFVFAVFVSLSFAAFARPLYQSGNDPDKDKEKTQADDESVDISKLTPYNRVGIIEFEDAGRMPHGEDRFAEIFMGRLKNQRPDTEFVEIKLNLPKDTPLMGEEARRIGREQNIDAIVTGSFLVKIVGDVYPTYANNIPVGDFKAECRVIETNSGWSRGKIYLEWKKNKIYSPTVKTQKDLEGKIMRDGAEDLIEKLTNKGYLFFEPEPVPAVAESEAPAEAQDTEEESGN